MTTEVRKNSTSLRVGRPSALIRWFEEDSSSSEREREVQVETIAQIKLRERKIAVGIRQDQAAEGGPQFQI